MKEYEVVGSRPYREHQPGETFTADLSEDEERRATQRGSIVVRGEAGSNDPPESTGEETGEGYIDDYSGDDVDEPVEDPVESPSRGGLFGRQAEDEGGE